MVYPVPPGQSPPSPARTVSFSYDAVGSIPYSASLIDEVTTTRVGAAPLSIAKFTWTGDGRRAAVLRANARILDDLGLDTDPAGGTIGINGLDRFGRVRDKNTRHFTPASGGTPATAGPSLTRLEYTYDRAGNRISATRTPGPEAPTVAQAQSNAYDALHRLVGTTYTTTGAGEPFHSDEWDLDSLGNWMAHNVEDDALGGGVRAFTHDGRNRITSIADGASGTSYCIYDQAGNLIFDGTYAYQYDAWQRLVQVNQAAPLLGMNLGGEVSGEIVPFEVGLFVRGFTYDGVGRLIRTVSPWPSPELSGGEVRVERYFYDGVRRISEVVTDPMEGLALAMASGGEGQAEAQQAYAAEPELEGESLPVSVQQGQEGGGGGSTQNSSSGNPNTPVGGVTLSREYIWGPGDAGLDELLVQFGVSREAAWPVHDAGGDLVALCDTGGAGGSARLGGEWTFDAYGNTVTATTHHAFAEPRLGHKGLIIERLDGGVIDPTTGNEVPRLEPGATTLAFARNRHLHTGFGRWLQEDPNATGALLIEVAKWHGKLPERQLSFVHLQTHMRDGANVYSYVGDHPLTGMDPLGLTEGSLGNVNMTIAINGEVFTMHTGAIGGNLAFAEGGAAISGTLPGLAGFGGGVGIGSLGFAAKFVAVASAFAIVGSQVYAPFAKLRWTPAGGHYLNTRVYIRKSVRLQVEARTTRTSDGRFVDPRGEPIPDKPVLGHKPGREFWRMRNEAEAEGLTREEFVERMNDHTLYQIESLARNRSHADEMP